jgi:hypothetical protein
MLLSHPQRHGPLAVVLCLAVASAPWSPSSASGGPPRTVTTEQRHLAGHGFVYRLELTRTGRTTGAPVAGAEVRLVRRAELPEAGARRRGDGSLPGRALTPIGADDARELAGGSEWHERIHWSLSVDESWVRSSYRVGVDSVSLSLPVEWITQPGSPAGAYASARLEVNGLATPIPPEWLLPSGAADTEALAGLERDLRDRDRFFESYLEFETVFGALREEEAPPRSSSRKGSCFIACLRCGGSLVTYAGSTLALIAACGSALVSGGSTILICLGAFLGHEATMIMALGACAGCSMCHDDSRREDCCDCRGLPHCNCPPVCPEGTGPPPWSFRGTR